MESNIPQEIKDKMNEAVRAICEQSTGSWDDMVSEGLETGYSLALPEISALKAEVERLRGIVEREYKSSFSDTHFTSEEIDKFWQEYKIENNL